MKKILIVDDDESIANAMTLLLEESGYNVETITDAKYIHKKLATFTPDIIILDMLLSGEDGRDLCKQIKANKKSNHVSIIMTSAHPKAKDSIVKAGADAFLAKPFETEELLNKIEKFIQNH